MDPHSIPSPEAFSHAVDVQIRFNDIDILGHLNNTVYFSFYDTGKAYYFEHIMARQGKAMDWRKVETVIANVDCAYLQPIFFGEHIEVRTRCVAVHDKSFILEQMLVEKKTGAVKSVAQTVMVGFDAATQTAVPLPGKWRAALAGDAAAAR